jgi:hypothetical protein
LRVLGAQLVDHAVLHGGPETAGGPARVSDGTSTHMPPGRCEGADFGPGPFVSRTGRAGSVFT